MKTIKIIGLLVLLFSLAFSGQLYAQTADIEANPPSGGTSIGPITFEGNPQVQATAFDFNSGTLPSGWSSSPYTVTDDKCAGKDSPDGSDYFWATDLESGGEYDDLRYVETNEVDVSNGGKIEFYIRYGDDDNGGSGGCEQPDATNEEVYLEYSTDGGNTWTTIYDGWDTSPAGIDDYPWYDWYWNSFNIPSGAQTTGTIFRWYQPSNSGDGWDNWGLEDVSIGAAVTVDSHSWKIDGTDASTSGSTLDHTFSSVGSYTVSYSFTSSEGDASDQITYVVNSEPTIDAISNQEHATGESGVEIDLTGISDGGWDSQDLSVSATSNNTSIVSDPSVDYTSPDTTGTLTYSTSSSNTGTATITVDVSYTNVQTVTTTETFDITVLTLPTVNTDPVDNISTNSATGNGSIDDLGDPDPTAHGVCWNTTGSPTTSDNSTDLGFVSSTGSFSSDITNLSPNTTYYIRAYATNNEGTGYGEEKTFTTNALPTASFTYSPADPTTNDEIEFDASDSSDPDGSIDDYKWDWDGDGIFDVTISFPTTYHSYSRGGAYTVELKIVDGDGETDSTTEEIEIGSVSPEALINHGPNPVLPEGCIFWLDLPDDTSEATLKVYDVDGRPLLEADIDPGQSRYPQKGRWESHDANGSKLGSGFYMYRLKVEHADGSVTWSDIQKMVVDRSK